VQAVHEGDVGEDRHAQLRFTSTQEPIDVLAVAQPFVEATQAVEGAAAVDATTQVHMAERLLAQALELDVGHLPPIDGDVLDPAEHHIELGILIEAAELPRELARRPHIVGIEERDHVAGRGREPDVPGRRRSTVLLAPRDHAVAQCGDHVWGVIGRSVVDDDDLEVVVVLCLDARDRLGEEAPHLEHRDDDADTAGDDARHDSTSSVIVAVSWPRSVPASSR
jgi:hypothetical protein